MPSEYIVLNDLVFPTDRGTTQIDHLVLSKYGIFAIETKNYAGEIYGDDERRKWTQIIVNEVTYKRNRFKTYTYVTKNHFYNPVKQAYGHVYSVKKVLSEFPFLPVVPIVVFVGEADLSKVASRNNVIYGEQLISLISRYKTPYFRDSDISRMQSILLGNNVRDVIDEKTHANNINKVIRDVESTVRSGVCPRCGGRLVKRSGKYGSFYGCSNYPRCKFTATENRMK